ncbi:MAG: hypothetical protein K0S24_2432 [Sphingobacterium sp.]|jgi:hypothetical protein|nr:hypothetical protein [Sphingobacterium sp.]
MKSLFKIQNKGDNVLTNFLVAAKIKYSSSYSERLFNEHPHKFNLYGLSSMLNSYKIQNAAIKINNKEVDIDNIQSPFIAHVGANFVVVEQVTAGTVSYRSGEKDFYLERNDFLERWSGITLLAEPDEHSIEPSYRANKLKDNIDMSIGIILFLLTSFYLIPLLMSHSLFSSGGILLVILNLLGLFLSTLLLKKQLAIESKFGDKICSLFKEAECNSILQGKAAKFLNIFSWSEIGFAYFLANLIALLFFQNATFYCALINIIVLPYSIWSLYYQKVKAKQWCPLCLLVQVIVWSIFVVNIIFIDFFTYEYLVSDFLNLLIIYPFVLLILHVLLPNISLKQKLVITTQEMNSIKANEKVFSILLKEQQRIDDGHQVSKILFGNVRSPIIVTIVSNPHCAPCAKLHDTFSQILALDLNNICYQYVFSSFGREFDVSSKFLIAVYFNFSPSERDLIYHEWYSDNTLNRERFIAKFGLNLDSSDVIDEFDKHKKWLIEAKVDETPTILVNGYKLPANYNLENLKFISKVDI